MTLDKEAARQALQDMEQTRGRARAFSGYRQAGPVLVAWGLAWMGGNLAFYYDAPLAGWIFGGLMAAATVVSIVAGGRGAKPSLTPAMRRKSMLGAAVIFAAIVGLLHILAPIDGTRVNAVISYLVGAIYTLAGVWAGARLAWLGVVVMGLVLAGWLGAREHYELIMGLGGGGALLAAGLWFWRQ